MLAYEHTLSPTRPQLADTRGSALTWALIVALVTLILVGILATIITFSSRQTATSQMDTQAYYTARSVSEKVTGWLTGTPGITAATPTDQQRFIASLSKGPVRQEYSEADLGGNMGRAEVDISINSTKDLITIVTTGFFGNQKETVTTTLAFTDTGGFDGGNPSISFPDNTVSPFEDDPNGLPYYEARETALNGKVRDSNPVIVGNETKNWGDYYDGTKDQTYVDSIIDSAASSRELTWRNGGNASAPRTTILGPSRHDATEHPASEERMFVTPLNGRWTINPLQEGDHETGAPPSDSLSVENNTRLVSLSMKKFDKRDLEIRLGGYNLDPSGLDNDLLNSDKYYNSLLMFDFADNADNTTENPFVEYYDSNDFNKPQQYWHPQNWGSMTIYTQRTENTTVNGGVDARLVFGPYVHKHYGGYASYYNSTEYVGNPQYGQTSGDFKRAFPSIVNSAGAMGMTYFPVHYGEGFSMYFLDDTANDVLLIQGVNILGSGDDHSVVYSHRGVQIGGGLVKANSSGLTGKTTREVNNDVHGIDTAANYGDHVNYFATTTRYSQILYNTDIVLRAPKGTDTPRQSRIFDATLPNDGEFGKNNLFSDEYNKKFSPTVRIIGGDIYVGAGQTLTIDGGRINTSATATKYPGTSSTVTFEGRTVTLGTASGEYTQVVAPDSITVAAGGTLVVRGRYDVNGTTWTGSSAYANVNAPIYVEGTLNLEEGAWLTNQVFCYGGGVVNIVEKPTTPATAAVVTWERRPGDAGDQDGIYVFDGGTLNIAQDAAITLKGVYIYVDADSTGGSNAGTMNIASGAVIAGDVAVRGTLNVNSSFTLDTDATGCVDDPRTPDTDESQPSTHGIFVYSSATLNIANAVLQVSGTSGKIHSFGGYLGVKDKARADKIFCNERDSNSNICEHWSTGSGIWMPQDSIVGGS